MSKLYEDITNDFIISEQIRDRQDSQLKDFWRKNTEEVNRMVTIVILALNPTMEGDTTNFYITRKLGEYDVQITTLARGLSVGDDLEYTDELTLGRSILGRVPIEK